ncbi:MAG: hypothetical protein IKC32_03410 [Clostridia bacterium]|nr:hypothetical protein [Clostridia bacterium]
MPRFNFQNQSGGGSNNKINSNRQSEPEESYESDEYYGDDVMPQEEYNAGLKQLWTLIGFCIVGWIVFCVGNAMMYYNDIGFILMLVGVLIVDLPCFKILLAGGSLAAVFGAYIGAERIIYYTDGTKKRDSSGWSAGLAAGIFIWLITLVVGAVAMAVRIIKTFFYLLSIKREESIHTDAKSSPWLPILIGIAVFVGGFIGINVVTGIIDQQQSVQDDYTDEETREMLAELKEDMAASHWQVVFWKGTEVYLTIEHDYYPDYDEDVIVVDVAEIGAEEVGLAAGKYLIDKTEGGTAYGLLVSGTQFDPIVDEAILAKLKMYETETMISADAMLADISNVNAYATDYTQGLYDEGEIIFTLKTKGASGDETVIRAGKNNGEWLVRMVESPYTWEETASVEFKYKGFTSVIP